MSQNIDICPAPQVRGDTRQAALLFLFSFSMFLSAAAMFMVQPMLGKMLLPRIGGTPAGWIAAVAFFQIMLLLGYIFAHGMARFSPRIHGLAYLALLIAGASALPLSLPSGEISPADMGAGTVFRLLLTTAGLPFAALAATAATVQRLFLTTRHRHAKDPYFLYAASNLGSFAGLLLYPLAIEPLSTLDVQNHGWSYAYGGLALCAAACLMAGGKGIEPPSPAQTLPSARDMARWAFLAFVPSALLLAVTTHIVTDIVSAPLIWVLPLALYLLTFILAFARRQWISPDAVLKITPPVIAFAFAHTLMQYTSLGSSFAALGLHLACFAIIALMCHQRLSALRPPAAHLTAFYLMIALGGALGGFLNAFVAPTVLTSLAEYPVFLLLAAFAHPAFRPVFRGVWTHAAVTAIFTATFLWTLVTNDFHSKTAALLFLSSAIAFACIYPRAMMALSAALFCLGHIFFSLHEPLLTERNFFGVLRVTEREAIDHRNQQTYVFRDFSHGTTLHGLQIVSPEGMRTVPTAYFHPESPIAEVLHAFAPRDVAVVGLGAGTLACHEAPERYFTFFEVDPAVIRIAQEHFSFLGDCPGARPHRLVEGDGRLALQREKTALYDIIILDAFSSDTVPPHLITVEAIRQYLSRLNAGGLIAFNVSSRYFDLTPVLAAAAETLGLYALQKADGLSPSTPLYAQPSHWLVMGPDRAALESFARAHEWVPSSLHHKSPAWRDNYSNILGVIRK